MKKYIIKDWAGNRKFLNKEFATFEDGWEFLDTELPIIYKDEWSKEQKGWFHTWVKKRSEDGGEFLVGIVETEKGKIITTVEDEITFTDR